MTAKGKCPLWAASVLEQAHSWGLASLRARLTRVQLCASLCLRRGVSPLISWNHYEPGKQVALCAFLIDAETEVILLTDYSSLELGVGSSTK